MTAASVDQLVRAVLYEGYALYPYRPSALKNQKRFAFGVAYPRAWAERALEPAALRVELLAAAPPSTTIAASVRFLALARGGETREHAVDLAARQLGGGGSIELARRDAIELAIELACTRISDERWRIAIELRNVAELAADADREAAMDRSPASLHVLARLDAGQFVSAIDPPPDDAAAIAACRSTGLYPVLVGERAMLASPIILPDFPELAPESPGDFFDGTEIDEMLVLRVATLTDAEKREAAAADPRVAALIERTERLDPQATARLHGTIRTPWPRRGARVRLRPSGRADAFDLVLGGKLAIVDAVERDLEGRVQCAVTLDDDPGADLPGHRFYFRPDELEVIA